MVGWEEGNNDFFNGFVGREFWKRGPLQKKLEQKLGKLGFLGFSKLSKLLELNKQA